MTVDRQHSQLWIVVAGSTLLGLFFFNGSTAFTSASSLHAAPRLRAASYMTQSPAMPDATAGGSSSSFLATCSAGSMLLVAGAIAMKRTAVIRHVNAPKKIKLEQIPRPENLLESPKFPLFQGTTDGYLARSTRERHAITWVAKDERCFEMPTGGCAMMNKGDNLCYFRKKEQAIFLSKCLRKLKISDIKIYRIKKDGTVVFMHPLDGLWPENQTTGRPLVNWRPFPISGNPQSGSVMWSKYHQKAYEVDPLTSMFVRARIEAFADQESLFPLPNPEGWVLNEDLDEANRKFTDACNQVPDLPKIFKP